MNKSFLGALSAAVLSLFAVSAHASVWISCGNGRQFHGLFEQQEAQFSSSEDNFSGSVGGTWALALADGLWLHTNKNVTAKTTAHNGLKIVTVVMKTGDTPTGPAGIRYVLTDIYSETPRLEKYNLAGGIAGSLKTGEYKCVSGND